MIDQASTLPPLLLTLVIAAVSFAAGLWFAVTRAAQQYRKDRALADTALHSVRPRTFLTPNELDFLEILIRALGKGRSWCSVSTQVSLNALVELSPIGRPSDPAAFWLALQSYAMKSADFVLVDRRTGVVLLLIELDDRSHSRETDLKRDALLAGAGFQTLRFLSKRKPTVAQLSEILNQYLPAARSTTKTGRAPVNPMHQPRPTLDVQ